MVVRGPPAVPPALTVSAAPPNDGAKLRAAALDLNVRVRVVPRIRLRRPSPIRWGMTPTLSGLGSPKSSA